MTKEVKKQQHEWFAKRNLVAYFSLANLICVVIICLIAGIILSIIAPEAIDKSLAQGSISTTDIDSLYFLFYGIVWFWIVVDILINYIIFFNAWKIPKQNNKSIKFICFALISSLFFWTIFNIIAMILYILVEGEAKNK